MMIKYDLGLFNKYTEEKLLRKAVSGDGLLVQYNYTDICIYLNKWEYATLFNRGNIYEKDSGRIIARAFPKFFNFEQLSDDLQEKYLKENQYTIYEKVDGCLGILYYYNN